MRGARTRAAGIAVLVALLMAPLSAEAADAGEVPAQGRSTTDVAADDGQDRFVGTGGLILPPGHDRRPEVAGCPECQWRLASACVDASVGQAFSGTAHCSSVTRGCADARQLLRVWFRRPGQAWQDLGLICLGEHGPVTVERLGHELRARVARALPPLAPTAQPATGVVAQLPVCFDSGQPGRWSAEMTLLGLAVAVQARAGWTWSFGDGAGLATTDPGGRYPHLAVSHAYRRPGRPVVDVASRWQAEYTVDGLGPYEVAESIEQTASLGIRVGEGRALLAVSAPGAGS